MKEIFSTRGDWGDRLGIISSLRTERPRNRGSFPGRGGKFICFRASRLAWGPVQVI